MRLPGEFFDEISDTDIPDDPDLILTKFGHYVTFLHFMSQRKIKKSYIWKKTLFSSEITNVRNDGHRCSVQPTDQGPFKVISKNQKYFELDSRRGTDKISIGRLKSGVLSFKNLNSCIESANDHFYSLASSSPKEGTSNNSCAGDSDDIFNESAVPPIVTTRGRTTRRLLKLRDY